MSRYDVLIIGAGPAGYVAAIRAAQLGLKTAVVEARHLGGICLNWGCIPTKSLLRSAELLTEIAAAKAHGIRVGEPEVDIAAMVARSRGVSARLAGGVAMLMRKNRIDVIWGRARLTAPGIVEVTTADGAPKGALGAGRYEASHIVIATGARPRSVPGLEPDGDRIWTYFDALAPKALPKSLLVVGSGAIGMEFATFYAALGTRVEVVEILDRILPVEDAEISAMARKHVEWAGITVTTGAKVVGLLRGEDGVTATIETEGGTRRDVVVERVLSAVGVVGNNENLGLEAVGVSTERGTVVVDAFCRSTVPGVYAIGDVAGPPMLAHKGEHEGVLCVEKIAGLDPHPLDKARIPGCTYLHPQVGSVGMTEAAARAAGHDVSIGRFPYLGNGKAVALGEPEGLVKVVFDKASGRLLGAHIVGADATELIAGYVVAMNLKQPGEALAHTVFPHPTLSEMLHEAVLGAEGRAIHA